MTFRRATSLLAKGVLGLGALVGGAVAVVRLERDRPRMLLERAGVEIGEEIDGTPYMAHFPEGAARNEHLLQLARFDRLRTIVLRGGEVGPDGLRALRSLRDLRLLDLSDCAGTPECLTELGRLTTLQELCLENCVWFTDAGPGELRGFDSLETLNLAGTKVSDTGLASLQNLPRLTGLNLRGCTGVTDDGLQMLARIPSLHMLNCDATTISRSGIRAFLRGRPKMQVFTSTLDMDDLRPLIDGGAKITLDARFEVTAINWDAAQDVGLVQWPYHGRFASAPDRAAVQSRSSDTLPVEAVALLADCPALQQLILRNVALSDAELAPLAEVSALSSVTIENSPIQGEGLRYLQSHHGLRWLRVSSPVLANEALQQVGRLTQLWQLSLECPLDRDGTRESEVSVTDEGLQHLKGLVNLHSLDLVGLPLTGAGLEHLQTLPRLGSLTLQLDTLDQESLRNIGRLPHLGRLSLAGPVTDDGIRHLSSAANLSGLVLQRTTLDAGAARELAALPKLTSLELHDAKLTDDALPIVATAPKLKLLRLLRTDCRDVDVQEIRSSRPALHVSVENQ